jgi:hypothetical protein
MRFRGHPNCHVLEVDIAPSDKTSFCIPESRHEIKLETNLLCWCATLKELRQFSIVVDRAHRLNKLGPIGCVEKLGTTVLFHHL